MSDITKHEDMLTADLEYTIRRLAEIKIERALVIELGERAYNCRELEEWLGTPLAMRYGSENVA